MRSGTVAGIAFWLSFGRSGFPGSPPESVALRGKFVTLAEALKARGSRIKPDPEPIAKQVVLLAEDGTIIPLLSDDASRALFLDERLRNCRSEIQGRRFAGCALSPGCLVQGRA